ncbi:NAD-dependent epimerase/dehydratase family protein [Desulfofundulus thermobenzoicus]|uniref:NAD-dependent epimerase/dehydratase family protein n=1 Tax=Desulfofundulus thermobenzoicus TaxID=29376 RepID=A0A6N7IN77_9FIRM|nr:GDP-mannose 4,6-dehydratase [Desulfofundulus thermobenzoicus]MQL51384.1 NAD-dependent epimerase/dehydratase family protein [Desulfofundulus thermobenzoicus]
MRALVTGAGGFVGPYLVQLLLSRGYEVFGTFRGEKPAETDSRMGLAGKRSFWGMPLEGTEHRHSPREICSESHPMFHPLLLDITTKKSIREAMATCRPNEIYHLAALAVTTGQAPEDYYRVNFQGTFNLLQAVKEAAPNARVLYVGSANAYGVVGPDELPVKESRPLCPNNHYAASKAAAEALACAYAAEGLHVICARPFNHTGPGQSTDFVCSRLAREVAAIATGQKEPLIEVGNLDPARDFTDVRDVVEAYWLLLQKGNSGQAYNVCSERAYSIRDIMNILMEEAGVKARIESVPGLKRKVDIPVLLGSREKISRQTGWEPKIPFRETLKDVLDYWIRKLVGKNSHIEK